MVKSLRVPNKKELKKQEGKLGIINISVHEIHLSIGRISSKRELGKMGEEENYQRNNKMKFSELSRLKGATECLALWVNQSTS